MSFQIHSEVRRTIQYHWNRLMVTTKHCHIQFFKIKVATNTTISLTFFKFHTT